MFSDSDLLPVSALQHYVYCPRQCALIHVEQQWTENRFTAEGRSQHNRVDRSDHEIRDGIRTEYAVPIRSLKLGLVGKADAVEYHPSMIFPVEHKRGRPKPTHCDWVQLCAQALCLEEMMDTHILEGAIFYGRPRRRQVVEFTDGLRDETKQVIADLHKLINSGQTPKAEYEKKKCSACSLFVNCMPEKHRDVSDYLNEILK